MKAGSFTILTAALLSASVSFGYPGAASDAPQFGGQGGFGGGQGGFQGGRGQGGGGMGGAGMQSNFGNNQQSRNAQRDQAVRNIEQDIPKYLDSVEITSVLTPGEFCEWTLKLKAGNVVLSEARSDAFDPALEIVDEKAKVLASNDDRYPGDQRPLLLWRCTADGTYSLHVRCFHDKSGGQFFVRFRTFESVDLDDDKRVEQTLKTRGNFLVRIPMKAGQIKEIISESGTKEKYTGFRISQLISPVGLPDVGLSGDLQQVTSNTMLLAPVAGDYYGFAEPWGTEGVHKIHAWTQTLVPAKLTESHAQGTGEATTNVPAIWELPVKKGEVLRVTLPELHPYASLILTEVPDLSKFDLTVRESNPFFPQLPPENPPAPLFMHLTGRARDSRVAVFAAMRDGKVWIATNSGGPQNKKFSVHVEPAAQAFAENRNEAGKLRIGMTDYWSFDAKAGDVMTLQQRADGFAPFVSVRDPDMNETVQMDAPVDSDTNDWRMIFQKPGKYLVGVSCQGDGGSGSYTLSRNVLHAREFSTGKPATDTIKSGQVQIWQFHAEPGTPLYVHWKSAGWRYEINIYDAKGNGSGFQREMVDGENAFGILKVDRPQTFVIVLSGNGEPSTYSIDLSPLPGLLAKPPQKGGK